MNCGTTWWRIRAVAHVVLPLGREEFNLDQRLNGLSNSVDKVFGLRETMLWRISDADSSSEQNAFLPLYWSNTELGIIARLQS